MALTTIHLHVSVAERDLFAAAAKALGVSLSSWVRRQAISATAGPLPLPAPLRARLPPRSSAGRECIVHTRLDPEDFADLVEHARACGLTVSGFVRAVLFGCKPIPRRPLLRSAIAAVNRAGNSLNRVVELGAGGALLTPDLRSAVGALRHEINALLDALLTADAAAPSEPPK